MSIDTTERAELEQLRLATQLSGLAIWSLELSGGDLASARVVVGSSVWESIGYEIDEAPVELGSGLALAVHPDDQARVYAGLQACIDRTTEQFELEYRTRHKDGSVRWKLGRGAAIRDDAGRPIRIAGTSVDVTRLKQIEEDARVANERLELAAALTGFAITEFDLRGAADAEQAMAMITSNISGQRRWPPLSSSLDNFRETMLPEDLQRAIAATRASLDLGAPEMHVEYRTRDHRDDSVRWRLGRAKCYFDKAGAPVRYIGVSVDIQQLKEAQEAARRAVEQLELATRMSGVSAWSIEPRGSDLASAKIDRTWEQLGYSTHDLPADGDSPITASVAPEDAERARANLQACIDGKLEQIDAHYRVLHKDGAPRWRLVRGVPIRDDAGRVTRVIGTSIDITRLKQVEEELRAANDRLDLAAKLVRFTITEVDLRGTVNPETAMDQAIVPEDLPRAVERFHDLLRAGPTEPDLQPTLEFRARHADGSSRWRAGHGKCFYDETGVPIRFLSVTYDIEKIKAAEEAAKRVTEQLQLTTRLSGVNVWSYELEGDPDITRATVRPNNESVLTSLGHGRNAPSTLHARLLAAVHPEEQERVSAAATDCISGKTPMLDTECRFVGKDGSVHWKLVRGVVERDTEGRPLLVAGTVVDIQRIKIAEEQAHTAVQQLRLATELSGVGLVRYELGDAGDIASATVAFDGVSSALGYDVDLLPPTLAARLDVIVHPEDRLRVNVELQDLFAAATPMLETELRLFAKDGSVRWWLVRGIVTRDSIGRPVTLMATAVDIASLKQTQDELHRIKDRLERAVTGSKAATWDVAIPASGDFTKAEVAYTNIWELLGHDVPPHGATSVETSVAHTMLPDERGQLMAEILVFLAGTGREWEREVRALHKSGRPLWMLTRGVLARDAGGRPTRFTGTAIDITELKQLEGELQRAREAAESANRAKDDFLANVSHEIRTPMNAILGMTELALDSAPSQHQRQLLSTVRSAARNLLTIIDDLLDFSKIAAGKLALDEADFGLRAEIRDTLRALAPRAHRKGLELICHIRPDVPDALFGDSGRLRQVLMNLVGNALKFTAQGEIEVAVTLSTEAPPRVDDDVSLVFKVRDTGIGIARDKQAAIFRAFEQEDSSTTRRYGGTGLGLTITAQLTALMNGSVTVDSEPGRGSTFTVTARFARSSRSEEVSVVSREVREGLRVLVVDDNETNRVILGAWLANWGMLPTAVGDAKSALAELAGREETGEPYPLILLDGRMPDVDGITLAGQILERYGASKRLILLSSDDSPILAARSREVGVSAHLLKPVQQSDLLETIWAVMNASEGEAPSTRHDPSGPRDLSASSVALRILVAEDNDFNTTLLKALLARRGHRVQFAEDGRVALKRATESSFDLVLLDLHMPELDGFEVVRAIRERERTTGQHLPIIALTARSSHRDRDRCLAAGMDDFLAKPVEAEALWAAIDRMTAAFPTAPRRKSRLLDQRAILRGCASDPSVFDALREVFQRALPDHLMRVRSALAVHDLPGLAEAAHKLLGTLGAFSTIAGAVVLTIEDAAKREDFASCVGLVDQLEAMCAELLDDTRDLSLDDLFP